MNAHELNAWKKKKKKTTALGGGRGFLSKIETTFGKINVL